METHKLIFQGSKWEELQQGGQGISAKSVEEVSRQVTGVVGRRNSGIWLV